MSTEGPSAFNSTQVERRVDNLRWARHQGWLKEQGKDCPIEITIPEDEGAVIGYRHFVDGTCRPVFEGPTGQYILDENGERIPGYWLVPAKEKLSPKPKMT